MDPSLHCPPLAARLAQRTCNIEILDTAELINLILFTAIFQIVCLAQFLPFALLDRSLTVVWSYPVATLQVLSPAADLPLFSGHSDGMEALRECALNLPLAFVRDS